MQIAKEVLDNAEGFFAYYESGYYYIVILSKKRYLNIPFFPRIKLKLKYNSKDDPKDINCVLPISAYLKDIHYLRTYFASQYN